MGIAAGIVLILVLLALSALISGSEIAFFSLSKDDKVEIAQNKDKISGLVIKLKDKPESLLSTILVSKIMLNVGIIIIAAMISQPVFGSMSPALPWMVIQIAVVAFLLLLFSELIPKVYANQYCKSYARFMAIPLSGLRILVFPIAFILSSSTAMINRRLARHQQNISLNELSHAIEQASDDLTDEKDMLEGIVNFSNIQVNEIMKPRMNIVGLDYSFSMDMVISVIVQSGYSRLPVYEGDFDTIRGILYVKDLLPYLNQEDKSKFQWQKLIRSFYFVPESKIISELLEEFQQKKIHMAIVIDEYGGTSGLVTLEDVLEEVVGEITDESDTEEAQYTETGKNKWTFDASISLNDFCKIVDCEINAFDPLKEKAETLAGLILEIKGEMTRPGE
ncbi:MAG TPA: gliding motility-associated protein GldE, partial [Bacteroidales bacterium]|nr:gliding motility-associated protein GldE [Bacteroidales bacterium]